MAKKDRVVGLVLKRVVVRCKTIGETNEHGSGALCSICRIQRYSR